MRHLKVNATKSATMSLLSLAAISLMGCAGDLTGNTLDHDHSAALTRPEWTHCSSQGEPCTFSGTRQVRFGTNGQSSTGTFTDSVSCSNRSFGVRFGRGNACEVLLDVEVEVDAPESPAPTPSHEHATASEDAGSVMAAPSAHDHTAMIDTAAAASVPAIGPYINKAAIPQGNPGVSEVQLRATDEQAPSSDVGQFRNSCSYSHMSYDDPIVFPGQPGKAHLHTFFGNTAVDGNSTAESIRNTGNSTCRGGIANRSAYWVPSVIAKDGTPLKPQSAQVYYKTGYEGIAPSEVKVFPQGLRMIAGDAKSKIPQGRAYWGCETYIGHPGNIPDCPAGEVVILTVQFPQCWNGVDLDSADHKSHMSYPVDGDCPSTHPYAMPEISFNIRYSVPEGTRSSEWRLSSDMYDSSLPGGYSAHGDWFEGWDREIAETFVKNCDQASVDCHSHLLGDGRMIYNSLEPTD